MKSRYGLVVLFIVMASAGVLMSGCRPESPAVLPTGTPSPDTQTVDDAEAPPASSMPTALAVVTETPVPTMTHTPTATPIQPTATQPPTLTPSATPVDPGAGLPCPVDAPIKPDYVYGGVGDAPLPDGDPARTSPHLWLGNPLSAEGLPVINRNYPYGSDSNGRYLLHNGLDFIDDPGAPLLAVADGTVIVAGPDDERLFGWRCDWYGHLVVVQLDQTWDGEPVYVLYGHVLDIVVSPGEHVQQGQPVAAIGVGGVATAPHLHLEVRVGTNEFGATRNPFLWLDPTSGYGVIAGRLVDPDGHPWLGELVTLIDISGQSDFVNTWTYLDDPEHLINSDEVMGENFAFGFVLAGEYDVYTLVQGQEYRQRVSVTSGGITQVDIVTKPYETPTPVPFATP